MTALSSASISPRRAQQPGAAEPLFQSLVLAFFQRSQGDITLLGSHDRLQEAFQLELITDAKAWMRMIQDRHRTSRTYKRSTTAAIAANISGRSLSCVQQLKARLEQRLQEEAR